MKNSLVGKYFLIPHSHGHGPHGKAKILSHVHQEFYHIFNFDLCGVMDDYHCIISLDDLHLLPLFDSIEKLEAFSLQIEGDDEPKTEVEVSH